ncbi:MAG: hypothetical protein KJ550_03270 [Proteobacteria bacterium]|nr:hypothetical protein [Desulfobacteraceae bacterium]MBU3981764.1 hypothetical protein [Pseudomonadota bacterium]MBU4012466.1 hypothetical protein [Pseudomonadota bacterium]MBU4066919.1 hypothetical protein [Pseudomonadota bacterium]MBU4101974.1 hypothetical protein [Pseudomonadota bacterium]
MKNATTLIELENILHLLNYRWSLQSLALWKGDKAPFEPYRIYEEYEDVINLDTLAHIEKIENKTDRTRLKHAFIDHYLQRELLPHETEMRTWMKGSAAIVDGEKIYLRNIIPWCQKSSDYSKRQILQKETSPLCKFMKPFLLNYWNILLEILRNELGFSDYLDYCSQKKGIDYPGFYKMLKNILKETDELYFTAMERWCRKRFNLPLSKLTRFDAINLLSLVQFDRLFPDKTMEKLTAFFNCWQIDINNTPGLNLELGREKGKSAQAMCFILQVPEEVYILMQPEGGWIDLETLWHELGHGFSAVFTSSGLSIVDKDMATSHSLSESFAFLLQNLSMSRVFLDEYLGLEKTDSKNLYYHNVLKDLSVFRRYAAKFIVEFEMFSNGDISDGELYARKMAQYTGFYYQPESHLFDLVPEFYCLDYILAWMAEAIMEGYFSEKLGRDWIFKSETGNILKKWWSQGNKNDIFKFFDKNGLGQITPDRLIGRWNEVLR